MRILTALLGLAATTITACAAASSLSTVPSLTSSSSAPLTLTAFAVQTAPRLSHECPDCGGSDHCKHCIGTGAAGGDPFYSKESCKYCSGTGSCQSCLDPHPLVLVPGGKR